jgi:hypothetical protein
MDILPLLEENLKACIKQRDHTRVSDLMLRMILEFLQAVGLSDHEARSLPAVPFL